MLKDSPDKYALALSAHGYSFYVPTQATEYHLSRLVSATNQQIYASNGATKETLQQALNHIVGLCNTTDNIKTIKTDVASICNMLLYRTEHPVDEHCAIRMGCTLVFMEYEQDGKTISEDPDRVDHFYQQKKEQLAFAFPELYTFFLTLGIGNIQQYKDYDDTSTNTTYFQNRTETIKAMTYGVFTPSLPTISDNSTSMPLPEQTATSS